MPVFFSLHLKNLVSSKVQNWPNIWIKLTQGPFIRYFSTMKRKHHLFLTFKKSRKMWTSFGKLPIVSANREGLLDVCLSLIKIPKWHTHASNQTQCQCQLVYTLAGIGSGYIPRQEFFLRVYSGQKKKLNGPGVANKFFPIIVRPFFLPELYWYSDHSTIVPKRIYSSEQGKIILHLSVR